jgi:hypothetical protein
VRRLIDTLLLLLLCAAVLLRQPARPWKKQ